jgi:hypothetical protein
MHGVVYPRPPVRVEANIFSDLAVSTHVDGTEIAAGPFVVRAVTFAPAAI